MLGDSITKGSEPCTKQLIDVYNKYYSSMISLEVGHEDKVERYGIIKGIEVEETIYRINELVEKPRVQHAFQIWLLWSLHINFRYF